MNLNPKKKIIAVIGASNCDDEIYQIAYNVGAEIAKRNCILLNGGGKGVMEASAKGAKDRDGFVIGIIPYTDKSWANPYLDVVIATGMGQARNAIIVQSADGIIAVSGSFGTLSEISFSMIFKKPIAGIKSWNNVLDFPAFDKPEDAVDFVFKNIN